MSVVLRKLYIKCELNMAQDKAVIYVSLWLPLNLVIIATRYVADAYHYKDTPCQI